jgi:hypothetical protein
MASVTGHELLIVGFGAAGYCGLCNAQMLNASWVRIERVTASLLLMQTAFELSFALRRWLGLRKKSILRRRKESESPPILSCRQARTCFSVLLFSESDNAP